MELFTAKLIAKRNLTDNVIELEFSPKLQDEFEFFAGQFINIKIEDHNPGICFRAYSLASIPGEKTFKLCVKIIEKGRGSTWLNALSINEYIKFMGPFGTFKLQNPTIHNYFLAVGTGIAPFKSMIETQLKTDPNAGITLLFGVRSEEDIFYAENFKKLAKIHANFTFYLGLSRPKQNSFELKGRITEILKTMKIPLSNSDYYICGLKQMIEETTEILIQKGVNQSNIHFERY